MRCKLLHFMALFFNNSFKINLLNQRMDEKSNFPEYKKLRNFGSEHIFKTIL